MYKYVLATVTACVLIFTGHLSTNVSMAAATNVSPGAASPTCATDSPFTSGGDCTVTPSSYKVTIYEMGLCTSHPYGTAKTDEDFDASTCVVTYSDAAPTTVDVATILTGGTVSMPGTSSAPAEGSYGYPYIIMGSTFITSAVHTNSVDTYYSKSDCTVTTTEADFGECTDNLTQFGNGGGGGTDCDSGYVGAVVSGGTIDAFVTNASLSRSQKTNGASAGVCIKSGRLVGVMTVPTPVTVTANTISVVYNFVLTNYGVQFFENDGGGDTVADETGSGPFSGYFVVTDAD